MDDQSRRGLPLPDGDAQGIADQFGGHVRRHRPANHLACIPIEDGGQVQPSSAGPAVGDVADISEIQPGRIELPVQRIGGDRQAVFAICHMYEFTLPDGLQGRLAHQPARFVAPHLETSVGHGRNQSAASVALACHERELLLDIDLRKEERDLR